MNSQVVRLSAVGLLALSSNVVLFACSSDDRPPAGNSASTSGGTGTAPGKEGGSDGNATGTDGGLPPADAKGDSTDPCTPFAAEGNVIPEITQTSTAPAATGGVIGTGVYLLSQSIAYEPGAPSSRVTGRTAQIVISIGATTFRMAAVRDEGGDASTPVSTFGAWSYQIQGTSLALKSLCPGVADRTFPFTAPTESSLNLLVDATHREVYTQR
jgi:hypothetical protein